MDVDVLVVGAGPTGLMLANQLRRRGVRTRIIDRHSGPAQQSRAMAVQARTLEIYSRLGIADRALALGQPGAGANMWARGRHRARVPLGDIGQSLSPHPYILMLGQDANEVILGERLGDFGLSVEWNTELVALEQHSDHVEVTLRMPDGSRSRLASSWIAGCDGGHSAVRRLNDIGFPGAPYEQVFYVADTEATGSMKPNELNVYLFRDGFHLFFPMHGRDRWRAIGILRKASRDRADLALDEVVPAITSEVGAGLSFAKCDWFSTYRIHHRCAERFRKGRAFLLGDAAHVLSPAGGQGMNTGLQDAYNLGWKLALVTSGHANPALLDTYEAERQPVARRLLRTTDRLFTMLVADGWVAGLLRTRVIARELAFAMKRSRVRTLAFRTISQIGIRYRRSPLSRTIGAPTAAGPHAGDRFPWLQLAFEAGGPRQDLFERLDDTRFHLLVLGQPGAGGEAARQLREGAGPVDTTVVPADAANDAALARVGIAQPSFFLLRPDGHIGLAGDRLDFEAIRRYLAEKPLGIAVDEPGGTAGWTLRPV
jgi:2-polyprenyl-6-methoxyphenol hydroxylase-like FAD-dependent oxidoreductase